MYSVAGIAVGCFVAGFVFRHCWPLLVAWQESKLFQKQINSWQSKVKVKEQLARATLSTEAPKSTVPRRVGIAEARARAEFESYKPIEHQAQVTQNNIAAMEGK